MVGQLSHSISHSAMQRGHVHRWNMASDLVGDTRIELVTSSVSRKRSPTELIAQALRGGCGNRTRVQGFAGPCLSHSANPPTSRATGAGLRRDAAAASSGRRDSNPRPSPWQGDALPTALRPRAATVTPATDVNSSRVRRRVPNRPPARRMPGRPAPRPAGSATGRTTPPGPGPRPAVWIIGEPAR
jgi:hypothetical protein